MKREYDKFSKIEKYWLLVYYLKARSRTIASCGD